MAQKRLEFVKPLTDFTISQNQMSVTNAIWFELKPQN